jgi:hypothetical protein
MRVSFVVPRAICLCLLPILFATSCKKKSTPPAELSAEVLNDSFVVAHLRGGDVWNNPVVRDLISSLSKGGGNAFSPEEMARKSVGLSPADLDTVTLCVPKAPEREPEVIVVVVANKPIDKNAILKSERKNRNAKMGFIALDAKLLLHFPDDRTFVVVHESLADRYLEGYAKDKNAWPISGALKKAAEGHTLAVFVDANKLPAAARDAKDNPFGPLLAAKSISLVADLKDKELQVSAVADFPDGAAASKSKEIVSKAVAEALKSVDGFSETLKRAENLGPGLSDVFKEARRALTETKVEASGSVLTVSGNVKFITFDLTPALTEAVEKVRVAAERARFSNNLKQIMLTLHNYASVYDDIVLVSGTDAMQRPIADLNGKAILSWRVALLPYIEQQNLYNQFKLNEPWDSEHNKKLIPMMPKIYAPVNGFKATEGKTLIQMVVGPSAMRPGFRIGTIPDGTHNTIAVVEASEPVIWTKPDDVFISGKEMPKDLKKKFGGQFKGVFMVGMWDGSVRSVSLSVSEKTLWNAIRPDDGEVLGSDW